MLAPTRRLLLAFVPPALAVLLAACATSTASSPSVQAVEIPDSDLTPLDRCMLDQGFRVVRRSDKPSGASSTVKEWESDLSATAAIEAARACREQFAPFVPKTDAEVRAIYRRWVDEAACLVRLGYRPAEAPTVEKFVSDWQTGPWMPVDGVDIMSWTDQEFQAAKDACGLEMLDR